MNKNILILFGGAVFVAFLVAMIVQISLGSQQSPVQIQKEERVEVLVAAADLRIGKELKDSDVRWQSWPKATVFSGAILRETDERASSVLSGRLRRDVAEGEPLARNVMVTESKRNFVAASLKPGMRAVAIKVSAESMVGGFLEPGDFVDVIMTYKETIRTENNEDPRVKALVDLNIDKLATETILEGVRVMAIDQKAERPDDRKIKVGKTVTLAVDARDAERLALAGQLGELTLSLRGIGDNEESQEKWPTLTDARLTNIRGEIFRESQRLKSGKSGAPRNTLRIYNGGAIRAVSVR